MTQAQVRRCRPLKGPRPNAHDIAASGCDHRRTSRRAHLTFRRPAECRSWPLPPALAFNPRGRAAAMQQIPTISAGGRPKPTPRGDQRATCAMETKDTREKHGGARVKLACCSGPGVRPIQFPSELEASVDMATRQRTSDHYKIWVTPQMRLLGLEHPSQIDVWQIDIDAAAWDQFSHVLHETETARASTFRSEQLRRRSARCRTAVRFILAGYLKETATGVPLRVGAFGKPEVAGFDLHFNVSHSMGTAVCALSRCPIGIDVESLAGSSQSTDDMKFVCHPLEWDALAQYDPTERARQFLYLWTRKEAYFKAIGSGLRDEMNEVELRPSCRSQTHRVIDGGELPGYFTHSLSMQDGCAGAVCSTLFDPDLRRLDARPDALCGATAAYL